MVIDGVDKSEDENEHWEETNDKSVNETFSNPIQDIQMFSVIYATLKQK